MGKLIMRDGRMLVLIGNNSGPVKNYEVKPHYKQYVPESTDAYALLTLSNGKIYKHEFYYGSTYLSQSSRSLQYSSGVTKIVLVNVNGESREVPIN